MDENHDLDPDSETYTDYDGLDIPNPSEIPDPFCYICGQSLNIRFRIQYTLGPMKSQPRSGMYTASEM